MRFLSRNFSLSTSPISYSLIHRGYCLYFLSRGSDPWSVLSSCGISLYHTLHWSYIENMTWHSIYLDVVVWVYFSQSTPTPLCHIKGTRAFHPHLLSKFNGSCCLLFLLAWFTLQMSPGISIYWYMQKSFLILSRFRGHIVPKQPTLVIPPLSPPLSLWFSDFSPRFHCCWVYRQCPGYDAKQFDGEVTVILELWGMRSTPSLPLLPSPLRPGAVALDKGPINGLNRTKPWFFEFKLCIYAKLNCLK